MFRQKRKSRRYKKSAQVIDIEKARQERREKRQAIKDKAEDKKNINKTPTRKAIQKNKARKYYFIVFIAVVVFLCVSAIRVYIIQLENKEILAENERLKAEKEALVTELENVNDPEYIEQQAREQLGLVNSGEYLIVLPEEEEIEETGGIVPQ